jgi:hypothetical protein
MAKEQDLNQMPVPDDDGSFPYEVRKDGEFFKAFVTFEQAREVCDKGNSQTRNFKVYRKGQPIWPE